MSKNTYTKENVLIAIRHFYNENGRIPLQKDFVKNPKYPGRSTVSRLFGTWNAAIIAAGFETADWSDEDLLDSLRTFYQKTNSIPTYTTFVGKFPSARTIENRFGSWNSALELAGFTTITKYNTRWSDNDILVAIRNFYSKYQRIPECRDFENTTDYPNYRTIAIRFGSWNKAIEAAGFTPNTQNSLGVNTVGLDGHLYRSKSEAIFANKFLFNIYTYDIEPPYPSQYNRYYDWYVPSLDLYIELDGGLRPEVTNKKISINNKLNRFCIFIPINNINKYKTLLEILQAYSTFTIA